MARYRIQFGKGVEVPDLCQFKISRHIDCRNAT